MVIYSLIRYAFEARIRTKMLIKLGLYPVCKIRPDRQFFAIFFPIAPRRRCACYPLMLSVKKGSCEYQLFKSFGLTRREN